VVAFIYFSSLRQNFELFDFELSNEDMFEIRKMNKGKRIFPEPDNADFGFTNW
jgi:diketogulonate reductase-like aldo/keto reductase